MSQPSTSGTNMFFYVALAAAAYFFFIKKGSDGKPAVSAAKVVEMANDQKKAVEKAIGSAVAEKDPDDGDLTVPTAKNSLVDMNLSGKELLGLQDGAGTLLK